MLAALSRQGEQHILDTFKKVFKSEFLTGKHKKSIVVSMEWVLDPLNYEKINNGYYNDSKKIDTSKDDAMAQFSIAHKSKANKLTFFSSSRN